MAALSRAWRPTTAVSRSFWPALGVKAADCQATERIVRSTLTPSVRTVGLPARSMPGTRSVYRPSGTVRPARSRPFQVQPADRTLVNDHVRTVAPATFDSVARPEKGSSLVIVRTVLSDWPSPSGEMNAGVARRPTDAGRRSTTIRLVIAARLFEASATHRVRT